MLINKELSNFTLTVTRCIWHPHQAHAVIDSRGGIWTKSAVRRRARLTINQDKETNAIISNSRYRSKYFSPNISSNRHSSTKKI
jgi:hypothetical protein